MRACSVIAWLLAAGFPAVDAQPSDFTNKTASGIDGQTIAFVGEKISLDWVDYACPEDRICLDSQYHARYRVVELLSGQYGGDTIDFVAFDHYGSPRFGNADPVVLYVYQRGDELYHQKYAFDALHPVKGGGYATCGDPFREYERSQVEKLGRDDLTAFAFMPPLVFKLSDWLIDEKDLAEVSQADIRDNFLETMEEFAPPAFEIRGDVATCRMGMSAKEIASVRMRYEYNNDGARADR